VHATGLSDLLAGALDHVAAPLGGVGALAIVLVTTMLLTPLVHHAAAVIIMGPIVAGVASRLGLHVEPFLMAVAIGVNSDFLTPIGHQNNTLVLGPGGYRFGDYWRLGLPLSLVVAVVGTGLIALVWPLR
jgi:di/tricarboxylate transporter